MADDNSGQLIQEITKRLEAAFDDPSTMLYNPACELVAEKKYHEAERCLSLLTSLYPDDGAAWMLRAQVFTARGQWDEALAAIDTARNCGVEDANGLRAWIISYREKQQAAQSGPSPQNTSLQNDLTQARHENRAILERNSRLERDNRRWAWVTILMFVLNAAEFGFAWARGYATRDQATVEASQEAPAADVASDKPAPSDKPAETPAEAPTADKTEAPAPSAGDALATHATQALVEAGLDGAGDLRVAVQGDSAVLSGKVSSARQLRDAKTALEALSGISSVDTSAVINLARRDGTSHVVVSGDSLGSISLRYYGTIVHSNVIRDANPQLGGKNDLQIGQKLVVPKLPEGAP